MTEKDWLTCTDPTLMLEFLQGRASDRKLRLFAVACCRNIWHLLRYQASRDAVEMAERYCDELASLDELSAAHDAAQGQEIFGRQQDSDDDALMASIYASSPDVYRKGKGHVPGVNADWVADCATRAGGATTQTDAQVRLLRCTFGPLPFRPVTLNPAWLTATVKQLAEAIYTEKAFERMPILGDALEESGCSNAEILNHCRQPGEHVRGCWCVDLLLGKE